MIEPRSVAAKQIRLLEKCRITISKHFYEKLELEDALIWELRGNELVLRPVPTKEDFSKEILKDLVQKVTREPS